MAASVTYPAPSRASSQLSVVVTVPSAVRFSRSQVIFGAAKYGSSGRPVIAVSSAERSASRAQTPPERRSCQTIAGDSGGPVRRSQASTVSPWLASATAWAGARAAAASACRPAATTDSNSSSGSASTPSAPDAAGADRDLAAAEHLAARPDQQRLGRRGALVDREDVHSWPGSLRIASRSVTSWTM